MNTSGESPQSKSSSVPAGLPADFEQSFNPNKSAPPFGGEESTKLRPVAASELDSQIARWSVSSVADTSAPQTPNSFIMRRMVARGGFGEVWEAVQVSLGRVIAVKRMREDLALMGSDDSMKMLALEAVFRQEALTAANLDHPNIAPVHDLGVDENGHPLLAMKLVRGTAWNHLLRAEFGVMTPDAFLARHIAILVDVAQAVAFAHSRGIMHRDLKPGQVMVGEFGEVLLMDWGLAVAFDVPLLQRTAPPQYLDIIAPEPAQASNPAGTLAYMAPEQTDEDGYRLGPWTDVFLLGATLYQLLTGTTPYRGEDSAVAFIQAQRGVIEPPWQRAPDRGIPPELAMLCVNCMMPEPRQRSFSAKDFVTALEEYLSGSGRRRESMSLTREAAAKLEGAASDYRTFSDCLAQLGQARVLWNGNREVEPLRQKALLEFARTALAHRDLVLARVEGERLTPGPERSQFLADIGLAESNLVSQRRTRRAALVGFFLLSIVLLAGSIIFTAELLRERKEAEFQRTAKDKQMAEAQSQKAEAEQARQLAVGAQDEAEELVQFLLTNLRTQLKDMGRLDLLDEAVNRSFDHYYKQDLTKLDDDGLLRTMNGLRSIGDLYMEQGSVERGVQAYDAALEVATLRREKAGHSFESMRDVATYHGILVKGFQLLNRAADVEEHANRHYEILKEALKLRPEDKQCLRELALAMKNFGDVKSGRREFGAAKLHYEDAIKATRKLLAEEPADAGLIRGLAGALLAMGKLQQATGALDESLESVNEACRQYMELLLYYPDDASFLSELGEAHLQRGMVLAESGDIGGSAKAFEMCVKAFDGAASVLPDAGKQLKAATVRISLGRALAGSGKDEEARVVLQDGHTRFQKLLAADTDNVSYLNENAILLSELANIEMRAGKPEEALQMMMEGNALFDRMLVEMPGNDQLVRNGSALKALIGDMYMQRGQAAQAIEFYEVTKSRMEELLKEQPGQPDAMRDLAHALNAIGSAHQELHEDGEAREYYTRSAETYGVILKTKAWKADWQVEYAEASFNAASLAYMMGDNEAAIAQGRQAVSLLEPGKNSGRPGVSRLFVRSLNCVALASLATGERVVAISFWTAALEAVQRIPMDQIDVKLVEVRAMARLQLNQIDDAREDLGILEANGGISGELLRVMAEKGVGQ